MSNIPPYEELDSRVQRTLDLLYQAFVDLLKEKHYSYIKIQEITKAAKINRATFYNHFENKVEFIIYCSREGFRRDVILKLKYDEIEYSEKFLCTLIQSILTFMSTEYSKWHYQWDEILFEKATRIELYYFLSEHVFSHESRKGQTNFGNTNALLLSSAIVGLGMVWCSTGCIEPVAELSSKISDVFCSGLQDFQINERR